MGAFLYCDESFNRSCHIHAFNRDAQLQATANCSSGINHLFLTLCDGNHQWQAMSELCYEEQREVKCHCQVAEFLQRKGFLL